MGRTADYRNETCSVAAALSVVGDPWTLLILRDAFSGSKRFEQWQTSLGVARNVLAARLKSLVAHEVFSTRLYSQKPPRKEYVLTAKGRDLMPVLLALSHWGQTHIYEPGEAPGQFIHTPCNHTLEPTLTCAHCREEVKLGDLKAMPEPDDVKTVGEALAS